MKKHDVKMGQIVETTNLGMPDFPLANRTYIWSRRSREHGIVTQWGGEDRNWFLLRHGDGSVGIYRPEEFEPWQTITPASSDEEVANAVRMLGRNDLDHECICTLARDRILALSAENAQLKGCDGSGLTVGHLRKVVLGLPNDAPVFPDWFEPPGKQDPAVGVDAFRVQQNPDGTQYLALLVSLHGLDEFGDDEEGEVIDA